MRELRIVTSDLVTFRVKPAGLATRAAAWFMDQIILMLVRIALITSMIGYSALLTMAAMLLAEVAYFTVFELIWAGQTPGKRRFGLRVATTNGARLSRAEVALRNFVRAADSLPAFMLLGGLVALFNPLGRRLGDLAAGTLVIVEGPAAIDLPPADRNRPNTYRDDHACRRRILARATREDRDLAVETMWRRDELEGRAREELFRRLAAVFSKRFALPEDHGLSDEQKVLNVALILADRDDG